MTQLEKKLKEMGYRPDLNSKVLPHYKKQCDYNKWVDGCMVLNVDRSKIINHYVSMLSGIHSQQDIDNIQIAFNNLERDIKEIKNETTIRHDTK